jgi:hypothetical protein
MADPALLRDWLFVRPSKRLLLEALLREPTRRWSRTELALAIGQHAKSRLDLHLDPLVKAGLVERTASGYGLAPEDDLASALRALLVELGATELRSADAQG